jgi:serine carboxypeptidase-like clade 2
MLSRYPWLCGREIYIAGESYAGHFTIQLATALAKVQAHAQSPAAPAPSRARAWATAQAAPPLLPSASSSISFTTGQKQQQQQQQQQPMCGSTVAGVMIGNGVVDINQTNYAWFEAGYTHSLVDEATWQAMQQQCDFTKDLGIDGNGCPRGVSQVCADLVSVWMNQSGVAANVLSLYDYYSDVCLADVALPGTGSGVGTDATTRTSRGTYRQQHQHPHQHPPPPDPCADDHTAAYLNLPSVRAALHVSPRAPAVWAPCSDPVNDAYSCPDTLESVVPRYTAFLADPSHPHRVLVYSGDVDGVVPTLASRRWLATVANTDVADPWRPWMADDGQVGGWTERFAHRHRPTSGDGDGDTGDHGHGHSVANGSDRSSGGGGHRASGGELVFATVRGAGHMVPSYQPTRAFALYRAFLRRQQLPKPHP